MSTCTKSFLLLACWLSSTAFAGGGGPRPVAAELNRRAALEAVSGVQIVEARPFDVLHQTLTAAQREQQAAYDRSHESTYTVTVEVGEKTETVFVDIMHLPEAPSMNIVQIHLANPRPTPSQQEALVRVGLGLFNVCHPKEHQAHSQPFWQARLKQPWGPWQDAQVGTLKVGWRGYENVPANQDKYFVGALDLRWPAGNDRCTF